MPSINDVNAAVRGPLRGLGLSKRAGQVFTVEIADGVLGWLGLNHASKRQEDAVEVNPVIGVRHQHVERIVARLMEEDFHSYQPPTVCSPLGYLMPDARYRCWEFAFGEGMEAQAREMVTAIEHHGFRFFRETASLEGLLQRIDEGLGHYLEYRRPVVCALLGLRREAVEDANRTLKKLTNRQDMAARQYRAFAEAFLRWSAPSTD